jgi:hypothetical protein
MTLPSIQGYEKAIQADGVAFDDPALGPDEATAKKHRQTVQLTVIAICVVLALLIPFLGARHSSETRPDEAVTADFDSLIRTLRANKARDSGLAWSEFVVEQLQSARASELRNDFSTAKVQYRRLRELIAGKAVATSASPDDDRAMTFIVLQLRDLNIAHPGD